LLAYGRWFSPCTPASSTTKTGRHDIAEILLKVALKHQKSKSIHTFVHFSDNHQKLSTINEVEIEGKSIKKSCDNRFVFLENLPNLSFLLQH
jgi:hypothetical protein